MGRVEARGVEVAFASAPVLDGIDLDVAPGEFVAILGPSGCGKSTLLRVVAGLIAPDAGTVLIDGRDATGRPGLTSFQPQRDALLPWRRVVGNAALGAELAGQDRSEARARAREMLARVGLGGEEERWPAQLSGGMRQRVAIVRTLLVGRAPLLLDEPFGALDALTRRQLHSWLEETWSAALGRRPSTVLVTHDVDEALMLADRVLVVSARPARVVLSVRPELERPRRDAVESPEWTSARRELLGALGVVGARR